MRLTSLTVIGAVSSLLTPICFAEDQQNAEEGYYQQNADDANNNAEEANAYYQGGEGDDNYQQTYVSDGIDYWTDYSILPMSCITQDNVDVITFRMFEEGYKQCMNDPMGTFKSEVSTYMAGFIAQAQDNAESEGVDYYGNDAAAYLYCTQYDLGNGESVYMKLGCDDYNKEKLAVNIYKDADCATRYEKDGSDDSAIDTSGLKVHFGQCQGCVVWYDKSDDQIDDNYWKNHKNQAPLCHAAYEAKETCSGGCLKSARVYHRNSWSGSEKFVLLFLFSFMGASVFCILKIRYLKTKDELLNNAETDEELNQEVSTDPNFKRGLIGIVGSVGVIAFICVLAKAKTGAWILLFVTSAGLFGYLMKLTLETGYKPCGDNTHYEDDSDDEDDEDSPVDKAGGDYTAPETMSSPPRSSEPEAIPDSGVMA